MTSWRAHQGVQRRPRGQALLELAAVMIVLLPLTMGILQFGIIYSAGIQLTNLTREGARYGAIHGSEANVESQIEDYIRKNAKGTMIPTADLTNANIVVTAPNKMAGQPITVVVVYDMTKKFFLPKVSFGFLSDANQRWSRYSQQATMTIE